MNNTTIPRAIIGLGNPGSRFDNTRHNIGFTVVDALAEKYHADWQEKANMRMAEINLHGQPVLLIKPQTFMNSSGDVVPLVRKQGIKPEEILVVHDELEKPFGTIQVRLGGSARGHNGLRSLIAQMGEQFWRMRCGIGRPERKEDVGTYVLERFGKDEQVGKLIDKAIEVIEGYSA